MKRISLLSTIIICIISCGQTPKKSTPRTLDQLYHEFVDVMLDSTSTWKQVTDVIYPFADIICISAADETSLKNRMFGQEWGYMIIELMTEKYGELKDAGKEVNYDDVTNILGRISDITSYWFYSSEEELPHIWRDHYYVTNKSAEEPIDGFFHIMVTMPNQKHPKPTLQIFYPENAEGRPAIIFKENLSDDVVDDNFDMKNLIQLDNWYGKHEIDDQMPMNASADEDVVQKMLTHPVMYLLFQSGDAKDGTPGELEVARVNLLPMQALWKEHVKE